MVGGEDRICHPPGGIAIRRDLGKNVAGDVDGSIRASLALAGTGSKTVMDYVISHAQEMAPQVVRQHIDLYVNKFSRDLGEEGEMRFISSWSRRKTPDS